MSGERCFRTVRDPSWYSPLCMSRGESMVAKLPTQSKSPDRGGGDHIPWTLQEVPAFYFFPCLECFPSRISPSNFLIFF